MQSIAECSSPRLCELGSRPGYHGSLSCLCSLFFRYDSKSTEHGNTLGIGACYRTGKRDCGPYVVVSYSGLCTCPLRGFDRPV